MGNYIKLKAKWFPFELKYNYGRFCLLSQKAREMLKVSIEDLHGKVFKIKSNDHILMARAFQGSKEDAPEMIINLNTYYREHFNIEVNDEVEVKVASKLEHLWFWVSVEHRSEIVSGIISGAIVGFILWLLSKFR